ncbi:MAG: hypothetical protein WA975_18005 [Mesorhizobium sp.]
MRRDLSALIERAEKAEAKCDRLAAEVTRLRGALERIRDYPEAGNSRRDDGGYPSEVIYDEFAYRRLVESYRECARAALASVKE